MSDATLKNERGISLVESLVILSAFISFAAYLLYSFSVAFEAYKLTEAGQALISELQVARLIAVTRNDQIQILFLTEDDQPALSPELIKKVRLVNTDVPAKQVKEDLLVQGNVRFSQMPVPNQPMIFDSRGSLMTGLGNYDEDQNAIILENSRGKVIIRVSASGRIQLAGLPS